MPAPLFKGGQIVSTPAALDKFGWGEIIQHYWRHITGDWGNLSKSDALQNVRAVEIGERILSSYDTPTGKLWIITEWDRSATTALLPEDY